MSATKSTPTKDAGTDVETPFTPTENLATHPTAHGTEALSPTTQTTQIKSTQTKSSCAQSHHWEC
jgi:hypothetical protein